MAALQHIASGFKHPDNMNRKDKLDYMRYLKRNGQETAAWNFYFKHGARISRSVFEGLK